VHRAHQLSTRPWVARPALVYPPGPEPGGVGSEEALPVSVAQIDGVIGEALEPDCVDGARILYDDTGAQAWAVLPLLAHGREMGTLVIEFATGVRLAPRKRVRLATAAARCAETLERERLFELQRRIAAELQDSLLPASLPDVPGLALGAEYRAGAERMIVGGDFYDIFPGTGGWAAIIGDVCGRGAPAAARTSLARHTARQAARHDDDPAAVLSALEVAIDADKRRDQLDLISAICLSVRTQSDGVAVRYAIAGHPLPLLIRAGGEVEPVGTPGPILGIALGVRYVSLELFLAPGDILFLYTDGVIESRRAGDLFGEERLIELLRQEVAHGASVQQLASAAIIAASAYNELHDDDMATLVVQAAR
jgi:serine phosphatase RsbU (regulator of sigma subunit)